MESPSAGNLPLSIGVIGARRVRHGIGPFVAAHLSQLGANVAAIAGTSKQSVAAALQDLQRMAGITPRGYTSVPEMFASEKLDAVAICSPDAAHAKQLQLAADAGVHVLCEKPLVFDGVTNPADVARPLVEGFAQKNLLLAVNEQWPCTLQGFDQAHPGVRQQGVPPSEFQMLLCPGATGREMIPNSLPHALSMLFALHDDAEHGSGAVRSIKTNATRRNEAGEADAAVINFVFSSHAPGKSEERTTNVRVELRFAASPPRPAWYVIDGCGVNRLIEEPGYQMFLEGFVPPEASAGSTQVNPRVPLQDPLRLLLADFLETCCEPSHEVNRNAIASLQALWQIYLAAGENPEFQAKS